MATRGTGKTYEEILAEENASGTKTYDETAAKVKQTAAQNITNQNTIIDNAAQNTTAQYQQRIDEAPKTFAGQHDANYIDELVARKNLENTMADMGLTDSGLNRSQQTTISVMRGNADAKTRQQQQDYVTAAQQAIDQVLAQAETDKASYANEVNSNADDYLTQLWSTVQQNAQTNATSRYNAQEESLDAAYKAQLEAEAEAEKWTREQQNAMIQTLVKEGMSYSDAVAAVTGVAVLANKIASGEATTEEEAQYYEGQGYTEYDAALAAAGQAKPSLSGVDTSSLITAYNDGGDGSLENKVASLMSSYGWTSEQADWVKDYIVSSQSNTWLHRNYKKAGKDTKDGWLYGEIDDNDQVAYVDSDGTEKTITLKELYKNLVDEGVDKTKAKQYVSNFNRYSDTNRYYIPLL